MRKISVITSFDQTYYNKIGKYCVETFLKYWDNDINLYLYLENFDLPDSDKYTKIFFDKLNVDYFKFQEEQRKTPEKTFAKKAYSIIHAMENIQTDILIWLDADVITTKNVDKELIYSLIPEDTLSTHFGVWHNQEKHNTKSPLIFSCETGFFALNTRHQEFTKFKHRYSERYITRDTTGLRRFYDGDVYGSVISELKKNAKMNDLNPGTHKTPIPRSILAEYITHFKHGAKRRDDLNKVLEEITK